MLPRGRSDQALKTSSPFTEISQREPARSALRLWGKLGHSRCAHSCRGHASEKPELPTALGELPNPVQFLGPPAGPMAALGDKIGSSILAQAAGVPTIPWSGSGLSVDYASCNGEIPADVYDAVRLYASTSLLSGFAHCSHSLHRLLSFSSLLPMERYRGVNISTVYVTQHPSCIQ